MADTLRIEIGHGYAGSGFQLSAALDVWPGWNVLFGPSGSGKSTLLRCIAGLLRPATGTIAMGQQCWFAAASGVFVPPERRRVGYVAQSPALFPHMTVRQNVEFGLRFSHSAPDSGQLDSGQLDAAKLMELLRCQHLAARRPAELSGGEAQRVALARALAIGPQVLLLDEPFRGLDAPLRDAILADLAALVAERSIAVLAASHDPLEPLALHARVFRMDGGKVGQPGPAAQVLAPEVAAMLQKLRSIS